MQKLPQDCSPRVIGARARQLVHYSFDVHHWEYHECTGTDHGIDCIIELVEDELWHNKKIEGQVKGTRKPVHIQNGAVISFPIEVKTVNYGLGSNGAFVLFVVDVDKETVYYLPLQDYFIANPNEFVKLEKNKEKINVHIPTCNTVSDNDFELQQIAKSVYIDGPSRNLRRVR